MSAAGVCDRGLLEAVQAVPRADFVPAEQIDRAFRDEVSSAFTRVPPPLAEQLADGGRLVQDGGCRTNFNEPSDRF